MCFIFEFNSENYQDESFNDLTQKLKEYLKKQKLFSQDSIRKKQPNPVKLHCNQKTSLAACRSG